MNKIFYIKDYVKGAKSDSEAIENCLAEAQKETGPATVIFDGKDYLIDRAILLPSEVTVIVDDCTIKQNDYVIHGGSVHGQGPVFCIKQHTFFLLKSAMGSCSPQPPQHIQHITGAFRCQSYSAVKFGFLPVVQKKRNFLI